MIDDDVWGVRACVFERVRRSGASYVASPSGPVRGRVPGLDTPDTPSREQGAT